MGLLMICFEKNLRMQTNFQHITEQIETGGSLSPFLFLSQNLELLDTSLHSFIHELLNKHQIDTQSLFTLPDTWESIKIKEIREFINYWNTKPRFAFQIFFIENISRMTTQAANAALKFFEEPWEGNIIFLTSNSESEILDTVLSRVQKIRIQNNREASVRAEYYDMVYNYFTRWDIGLVTYLYTTKLEKQEYSDMLRAVFEFVRTTRRYTHVLDELERDIQWITKNNLNGKYVIDKYMTLFWA